jgi:glycosyltransferase involved in cell wall biosynthesis
VSGPTVRGTGTIRVAYMLGTFPALTETFVLREIGALRLRGIDIVVCAIRRPTIAQRARLAALATDAPCLYARPDGLLRHAAANVAALLRHPKRYLEALRKFLREGGSLPPREAFGLLFHFVAGVGFLRDLRRLGVRHVHCHFNSSTNMALAAHLVGDVPFSFTVHANPDLFIQPTLLEEKVRRASFVVAVCEYNRRFLNGVTGYRHSAKIHRIHNGIERLAGRGSAEDRGPAPRGAPGGQILAVGSLVTMKGHATLIQACATLRERGRGFRCRIIGEGPERTTLERLIRSHDLEDCVELAGARPLDEVYSAMSDADVFVLLSEIGPAGYRDSFPTVILEAMAAGLPVLSTSLSGIPEMVVDGVTGYLVRERDVESATQALECLLESEQLRRSMGERGRTRAHELFDVEHSADRLVGLFTDSASSGASVAAPARTR